MMAVLTALHDSAVSTWIRESESVWAFPTVLTVHTFGMMLLVGCAWVMDLRLLGVARSIPIGPLRPLFRVMWAAFWINLASGVLLFGVKMLLIIVNLPLLRCLERAVYGGAREPAAVGRGTRQLAAASAALWAG